LSRDTQGTDPGERRFASLAEAAEFLRSVPGRILLTTGSKELEVFADEALRERVFPRILPSGESLAKCAALGFPPKNLIAMQGPFPEYLNRALLRHTGASWLVTKETGDAGGFAEKVRAASGEGAGLVVIPAPEKPAGYDLEGILDIVLRGDSVHANVLQAEGELARDAAGTEKLVYLVGTGPGSSALLTGEALDAIARAGAVIGAERLLKTHAGLIQGKPQKALIDPEEICRFIGDSSAVCVAVLLSGDSGFYSGAKRLLPLIKARNWRALQISGLSSVACLAARLGLSWEDASMVSLHGRSRVDHDGVTGQVMFNPKVFFLTDSQTGAAEISKTLAENGLGEAMVSVGENLSSPDERIQCGTAAEMRNLSFDPQSVVLVQNPSALSRSLGNYGFSDGDFERSPSEEKPIPMTKAEIRSVAAAKLRLEEDSVVWDIGAGTGALSCELAVRARYGRVFAIEQNPKAAALVKRNRDRLRLGNIAVVEGRAPEALAGLPPPDRVFIGGSGGDLGALVSAVLAKNPAARIVATALTTETLAEMNALIKNGVLAETELIQIAVTKADRAGGYHLFRAANPVFMLCGQGAGELKTNA
jgi:precorrin-6Y C5,15-methyltransferase (decarboxylating)